MAKFVFLLFSLAILLPKSAISSRDSSLTLSQRKPYRSFNVLPKLQINSVNREIDRMSNKVGVKLVVITNEAKDFFRISCSSVFDQVFQNERIDIGWSVMFKYNPLPSANNPNFRCGLDYKGFAALWDAANDLMPYIEESDTVYHYIIRHDGVYINERKIQGLVSSENRYVLCKENYVRQFYPDCLPGYVNEDVCNNLPAWITKKVSSVSIGDFGCVILYDEYNCSGESKKIKITTNGRIRDNLEDFKNKAVSLKGCSFSIGNE